MTSAEELAPGYALGRSRGHSDGWSEGYDKGKREGKREGYGEGYNAGVADAGEAYEAELDEYDEAIFRAVIQYHDRNHSEPFRWCNRGICPELHNEGVFT